MRVRSDKLLTTSGIADFTLHDVTKPEPKRLRRNLSAVINFVKFHEDRQPGYSALIEKTEGLQQQKAQLEEENERLVTDVGEANRRRLAEEPEEQALRADNSKREVVVRDLFNKQTELHNECQVVKQSLRDVQDQIREAEFQLLEAKEERENLKAQIVPDSRKLKSDISELQASETSEKAQLRSLEVSISQHAKRSEALERAEREIDAAIALQAECEGRPQLSAEPPRFARPPQGTPAQRQQGPDCSNLPLAC